MATKRGRKALIVPRIQQKLYIDADVLADATLLLLDPLRGRIAYGALSDKVNELLRAWVVAQKLPQTETAEGE